MKSDVLNSDDFQTNVLTIPVALLKFFDGDVYKALMFSQLLYWSERTTDQYIAKSFRDWENELCLSPKQSARITLDLVQDGLITTVVRKFNGVPTRYYAVNWDVFLTEFISFLNRYNTEED